MEGDNKIISVFSPLEISSVKINAKDKYPDKWDHSHFSDIIIFLANLHHLLFCDFSMEAPPSSRFFSKSRKLIFSIFIQMLDFLFTIYNIMVI